MKSTRSLASLGKTSTGGGSTGAANAITSAHKGTTWSSIWTAHTSNRPSAAPGASSPHSTQSPWRATCVRNTSTRNGSVWCRDAITTQLKRADSKNTCSRNMALCTMRVTTQSKFTPDLQVEVLGNCVNKWLQGFENAFQILPGVTSPHSITPDSQICHKYETKKQMCMHLVPRCDYHSFEGVDSKKTCLRHTVSA